MKRLLIPAALAAFTLCLGARAANEDKTWMVVDLRTGALSYYGYDLTTATNTFNTPLYKTEKMVFRRVPEGLYWCRGGAHVSSVEQATMGRPYYIGMFPVTEAQYTARERRMVAEALTLFAARREDLISKLRLTASR